MKKKLTQTAIHSAPSGSIIWDIDVPGLGIRTSSKRVQTYFFQFRIGREQGKLTIGRHPEWSLDMARKEARKFRVSIDKGEHPGRRAKTFKDDATVEAYARHYLEEHAIRSELAASTISDARHALHCHVLPNYGKRSIASLKVCDVEAMRHATKERAGKAQANRAKAVLSKLMSLAIRDEVISTNPCQSVKKYDIPRRLNHMSEEEVSKLLAACDSYHDQHAANAIRLLLFTGARLREVLNADWSQFNLDKALWTRPSSHTKTKIDHRISLPDPILDILIDMRNSDPRGHHLFPGRSGKKPRVDLKRPWATITASAGIGHWRIHDLRRTTASFMISAGADLYAVGKTLGHTQAQTTASYSELHHKAQHQMLGAAVITMQRGR